MTFTGRDLTMMNKVHMYFFLLWTCVLNFKYFYLSNKNKVLSKYDILSKKIFVYTKYALCI